MPFEFTVKDKDGARLKVSLEARQDGLTLHLVVYAKFWFINHTGVTLVTAFPSLFQDKSSAGSSHLNSPSHHRVNTAQKLCLSSLTAHLSLGLHLLYAPEPDTLAAGLDPSVLPSVDLSSKPSLWSQSPFPSHHLTLH